MSGFVENNFASDFNESNNENPLPFSNNVLRGCIYFKY